MKGWYIIYWHINILLTACLDAIISPRSLGMMVSRSYRFSYTVKLNMMHSHKPSWLLGYNGSLMLVCMFLFTKQPFSVNVIFPQRQTSVQNVPLPQLFPLQQQVSDVPPSGQSACLRGSRDHQPSDGGTSGIQFCHFSLEKIKPELTLVMQTAAMFLKQIRQ